MDDARKAIESVFRIERVRLIGGLARRLRDLPLAEEFAQDALAAALVDWPRSGVPERPGAWLAAAARRRAIDHFRRREMWARRHAALAFEMPAAEDPVPALEARLDDEVGDESLALIFIACHPALTREARAALTLRLVAGLSVAEIARAFLLAEGAAARRITRAKAALAATGAAFEAPRGPDRAARIASVLEVLYLIFNEGYAPTSGAKPVRADLCAEALRLARALAHGCRAEPEVWGLLGLIELQGSRRNARATAEGLPIPLPEQDRARWDRLMIRRGLAALERARALGGEGGDYELQAAIAACHARASRPEAVDWAEIARLYDRLVEVRRSPVVALNRAVAWSMAEGPQEGLVHLRDIEAAGVLRGYAPLPAAIGDCLRRMGRPDLARPAFLQAARLSRNDAERAFLLRRADACVGSLPREGADDA